MSWNGNTEGIAVALAAAGVAPSAGTPVTSTQLQNVWKAVCTAMATYETVNVVVLPGTFANGSGAVTGAGALS